MYKVGDWVFYRQRPYEIHMGPYQITKVSRHNNYTIPIIWLDNRYKDDGITTKLVEPAVPPLSTWYE